jgi:hypothetical protein
MPIFTRVSAQIADNFRISAFHVETRVCSHHVPDYSSGFLLLVLFWRSGHLSGWNSPYSRCVPKNFILFNNTLDLM